MIAVLTLLPFMLNNGISALTNLQFLGVGIPPDIASLGELLLQGKSNLHAPWLGITSFIAMTILLSILIFIGEGLRDSFDPRKNLL
jgi:microcin C transport system permease protein